MPNININDLPVTRSDVMNRDHKEFVVLLNSLIEMVKMEDRNNEREIDVALENLLTHTGLHFAREEELMLRSDFPPYPEHKDEHDRILKKISESFLYWKLNRNRNFISTLLEEHVPEWILQHVTTMDSVTAEYLENTGHLQSA